MKTITTTTLAILKTWNPAYLKLNNVEVNIDVQTNIDVMIDGKNFFDQPINSMIKTYENIRKIAIGQRDDYTTSCLLDYTYSEKYYKMIAIDLSKQQALDALDSKQFNKLILQQF